MLGKIGLFVALIVLFIAVFCIFNARLIVKNRVNSDSINRIVTIVKILGTIVAIGSLIIIYYIR